MDQKEILLKIQSIEMELMTLSESISMNPKREIITAISYMGKAKTIMAEEENQRKWLAGEN